MPIERLSDVKLLGAMVLIECEEENDRVRPDSIIIIPPAYRGRKLEENFNIGRVVQMGPGMKIWKKSKWVPGEPFLWPMPDVEIGARVIYRTWAVRHKFTLESEVDGKTVQKTYEIVSDESLDGEIIEDVAAE